MAAEPGFAWINGEFVPFRDAKVHVRSDCVMRGGSVFEGIPGYWSEPEGELFLFRVDDHLQRLAQSMKLMRMAPGWELGNVRAAVGELVARCGFREDVHVRPMVYFGEGPPFEHRPGRIEVGACVTAVPLPRNVIGRERGLRAAVSSWTRISDGAMPPRIKASANYQNSRLAEVQARVDGYDTAILLNDRGHVAETPASCVFLLRGGRLVTPQVTDGILESITRATVVELAETRLGFEVTERAVDRTELYVADEVFEVGSAHEVTPIVAIDGYPVGSGEPGEVTRRLMALYDETVRGFQPDYRHWLEPVHAAQGVARP